MTDLINNAEHWDRRATEAHDMAARIDDPEIKSTLLRIAAGYARMATRVRQEASGGAKVLRFCQPEALSA